MARTKNKPGKRKQPDASALAAAKRQKSAQEPVTPPPDTQAKTIASIGLCDEDIEFAIDTLNTLRANPAVIKTKACKDLRTTVYEFSKACTTGLNATSDDTNLTAKISVLWPMASTQKLGYCWRRWGSDDRSRSWVRYVAGSGIWML